MSNNVFNKNNYRFISDESDILLERNPSSEFEVLRNPSSGFEVLRNPCCFSKTARALFNLIGLILLTRGEPNGDVCRGDDGDFPSSFNLAGVIF